MFINRCYKAVNDSQYVILSMVH